MRILVVGAGGREHALIWKLKQSPRATALFCAPGNGGIGEIATRVPIRVGEHAALLDFVRKEKIDLTIVGPDDALAAGLVDFFEDHGQRIFGPRKAAAKLEWSKAFAKDFMARHGIPTARSGSFTESAEAHRFCQRMRYPVVIKADGLALGKGVIIAPNPWSAAMAIHQVMEERRFGEAGRGAVIEEFLEGEECSIHLLVDGANYLLFPAAQDHKRAFDGDRGPNTGGMGTFSPPGKLVSAEMEKRIRREIVEPFMSGLRADGIDFRGMLFPGLMITADGPKVLEFNCRFGDPETQVLLPRLRSDFLELIEATIDRRLSAVSAEWRDEAAVCVVLASQGYPGAYSAGKPVTGLDTMPDGVVAFHAGTEKGATGEIVTAGGRVLGVTALGTDVAEARELVYRAVEQIQFEGRQFRRDIAVRGLETARSP